MGSVFIKRSKKGAAKNKISETQKKKGELLNSALPPVGFLPKYRKIIFGVLFFIIFCLLAWGVWFELSHSREETFVFKNVRTVAIPQIVAGLPVKMVTLVDVNEIKNGKHLVKIPKSATDITVKKITPQEIRDLKKVGQTAITPEQRTSIIKSTKTVAKVNFSKNFLGSLLQGVNSFLADDTQAVQDAVSAIAPDINTQVVDVSAVAAEAAPAETPQSGDESVTAGQAPASSDASVVPSTDVIPADAGIQVPSSPNQSQNLDSPVQGNDNSPPDTNSPSPTPAICATDADCSSGQTCVNDFCATPAPAETPVKQPCQGNATDNCIAVQYTLPAPVMTEQPTDTGKLVTISAPNEDPAAPLIDVLAFTEIPEIYKVGDEGKIKIKWKNNGNQDVTFHAQDTDGNGKLDYVEWTVPHLSDQTFEIIFISKAFQLDADKNIIADIYDTVATQDGNYATVPQNNYVRTTFEKVLDNTKDITVYARPTDSSIPVSINVFPVYTDADGNQTEGPQLTTVSDGTNPDFSNISSDGKYRILLQNLSQPTDVFDLKIVGGSIDIDYIVDPSCSCASSPCTLTATCTWTVPAGVTSVQVECWGGGQSGLKGVTRGSAGHGGIGGDYVKKNSVAVTPGNSYTVTVGTGGNVCSSTTVYNNGNDSWFSATGTVLARGGGSTTTEVYDTLYTGGTGGSGASNGGGGGGSSAGTGANGGNGGNGGTGAGGLAGIAPAGGGNGAAGGYSAVGGNAAAVGGAGGGGSAAGTGYNGGSGYAGQVILTYTVSDPCSGGTYHWTGASGGSWITPGNWSSATNGAGDCTSYPNAVTAAVLFDKTAESDTVVMPNSTISVGAITFPNDTVTFQGNAGGSSVLSTNDTSSTAVGPTFDTNMTLTINAGTFTVTSGQTLTINKALTTVSGATLTQTGPLTFGTSATATIASGSTFTSTGTLTIGTSANVTNNGTSTSVAVFGTSAGTWTQGSGSTLTYSGSGATMPATLTATASNTVTYTNDGATTIAAVTYYNLTVGSTAITAARTYTLANNTTVTNVCTITGNSAGGYNAKLDPTSSYTLTLSGTGTPLVLTNANSIVNTAAGTVSYTAAGSTNITSTTYNNLTVGNSSGTDTAAGAIVVNTGLTTTAGGIFDMSTYQLTGGFTPTNGGTLKTSYASGTNVAIPTGQTWAGTVQFALAGGTQYCPAGTFTTLTFSNSSNTDTASGNITATTLNTTSSGTLAMGANNLTATTLSNSGLITVSTGSMSGIPSGSVGAFTFTGTNTIPARTYSNLTLSGSGIIYTAAGSTTVTAILLISDATGTFDLSGGAYNLNMSGGTLNNSGTIKISTGTITMPGTLTAMGSWTFTAANTVPSATYSTLTLSNTSGTDTAAGAIVVNTALTTTSGGTFDMSTYQLTGGFTPTNGGTLKTSYASGTNVAIPTGKTWTGTVQFALSTGAQYCPAGTFTTLTFSNTSNTDTVTGAIIINGTLSTTGNATFQDNVTINSGGIFSDTTGDTTLTFTGGKTVTINSGGQFTITGTNGHNVILTKTGTGNWNLTMSGTYSITYATVSYSTANTTITPTTSTDGSPGGTNVNWTFAVPNSLSFSITGASVGFGTLSTSAARYATSDSLGSSTDTNDASTFSVSSNSASGYTVTVSDTATGNSFITFAIGGTATSSATGTQQFGIRLIKNSGNGTVSSPYGDISNTKWALDSANFPSAVATGAGDGTTSTFGVRYICNVSPTTSFGSYTANLIFNATASF